MVFTGIPQKYELAHSVIWATAHLNRDKICRCFDFGIGANILVTDGGVDFITSCVLRAI